MIPLMRLSIPTLVCLAVRSCPGPLSPVGDQTGGDGLAAGGRGTGQPKGANLWCRFFANPTPPPLNIAPDATAGAGGDHLARPVHRAIQFGGGGRLRLPTAPHAGWQNRILRTKDWEWHQRLAQLSKSGLLEMVNGIKADCGLPFTAMKANVSGREGGIWGLEEYTVIKVVSGVK
jgi:aldehyde dehydrogenase (NAD+)